MTREEIMNMPAGREMDRLVVDLMGWEQIDKAIHYRADMGIRWAYQDDGVWKFQPGLAWLWSPSKDIAAAWEVVEKMQENPDPQKRTLHMVVYPYSRTYATFDHGAFLHDEFVEANGEYHTPLAICRAARLAVMESR